jgi:hypothetical protein
MNVLYGHKKTINIRKNYFSYLLRICFNITNSNKSSSNLKLPPYFEKHSVFNVISITLSFKLNFYRSVVINFN